MEEMNEMPEIKIGSTLQGTVVKVEDKQVFVDIGYKSEGIIPISELSNLHIEHPKDIVEVGEELSLKVTKIDDDVVLSKKAVDADRAWEDLEEKYRNGEVFETVVKEVVKGGLVADVGLRGFIPASLVETYYVEDFSDYVDKSLRVKIVDLDREQNRIILSHRAVLEEEAEEKKEKLFATLEEGQVIEGVIQRLTDFGAFVDIGGVDGLVHISELAHEHVEKASDVVSEGETIEVEVLSIDEENERISLSRKNTIPVPWDGVSDRIENDISKLSVVNRFVRLVAMLELELGVEGLDHISQRRNHHIGTPEEVLEVGQQINVKVLDVNEEDERISLSIKQVEVAKEEADIEQYERKDDQAGFQLGDVIGDQLDKYKQ